jgi:GxxExxY protein
MRRNGGPAPLFARMGNQGLLEEALTHSIIGAFYEVNRHLGFGLLEQLYASALEHELRVRGHQVGREVRVPVVYKGLELGWQRLDMLVDGRVIVEVKATEVLAPTARHQLLSYLSATRLEVGLLLHFGPKPRFYRLVHSRAHGQASNRLSVPATTSPQA